MTRKELEEKLFSNNTRFRSVLNGRISACKGLVKGMEVEQAARFMIDRYGDVSEDCFQYLLFRLEPYI